MDEIKVLGIEQVINDPGQPRQTFNEESLQELADSIKDVGLLQPILVRPDPDGEDYLIVHGERRWRACKMAGLAAIRAQIDGSIDEHTAYLISLVENEQREDVRPVETARALQYLKDSEGLTQEGLALRINKGRGWVAQKLQLLPLPEDVQALVNDGLLTETHAKQLIRLRNADLGDEVGSVAAEAASGQWSVSRLTTRVNLMITKTEVPEIDMAPEEVVRLGVRLGLLMGLARYHNNTHSIAQYNGEQR